MVGVRTRIAPVDLPGTDRESRLISRLITRDGLPDDDVARVFQDAEGNIWFSALSITGYPPPGRASGLGMWKRKTGRLNVL